MFDISWSHLSLFALAAIVLIPSKELPGVLRQVGRYVGDAKRMANDFRRQVDDALRETELADLKDSVTKEMAGIEKAASLTEEQRSLNSALTAAAATSGTQPEMRAALADAEPSGQVIATGTSLPITETKTAAKSDSETFGSGLAVPMQAVAVAAPKPALLNASSARNGQTAGAKTNDGIEIVRAGRGSVAQRAAAAWKKTAGGAADNEGGA